MNSGVVICGGGTGGHINPGLAVAMELEGMGIAVSWLGSSGGMEERLVPDAGFKLHTVRFAAPKPGMLGKIACAFRLMPAIASARKVLRSINAKVVLGLGGYPSLPGVVASLGGLARRLIHEQNAAPGLANRILAPVSHRVLTSHKGTLARYKAEVTGNPVRRQFAGVAEPNERFRARKGKLRLLVLGGSQGARTLNAGVPAAMSGKGDAWQVEHAAGKSAVEHTRQAYEEAKVEAVVDAYFSDMDDRMARADLVICRAGASTVAELACVGVASVLVPYPHAGGHQKKNTTTLVGAKAAIELDDKAVLDKESFSALIAKMSDRNKLLEMAKGARKASAADAAHKVALACQSEIANV